MLNTHWVDGVLGINGVGTLGQIEMYVFIDTVRLLGNQKGQIKKGSKSSYKIDLGS